MTKLLTALLLILLLSGISGTAAGGLVPYSFTADGNLAGTFVLDDAVPFVVINNADGSLSATLSSPTQQISGEFGAYTFEGTATLHIFDQSNSDSPASDHWIVRSVISGPEVNGLTPAFLNLFMFTGAGVDIGASVIPPPIPVNAFDLSYAIAFSDGSFITGQLDTLEVVPEPSTMLLLAGGSFGLVIARWHRRLAGFHRRNGRLRPPRTLATPPVTPFQVLGETQHRIEKLPGGRRVHAIRRSHQSIHPHLASSGF